jgi:hypothetical protein
MAYAHTNSKGQEYFLHQRDVILKGGREQRIYFFAREVKDGAIENARTGLPIIKKG